MMINSPTKIKQNLSLTMTCFKTIKTKRKKKSKRQNLKEAVCLMRNSLKMKKIKNQTKRSLLFLQGKRRTKPRKTVHQLKHILKERRRNLLYIQERRKVRQRRKIHQQRLPLEQRNLPSIPERKRQKPRKTSNLSLERKKICLSPPEERTVKKTRKKPSHLSLETSTTSLVAESLGLRPLADESLRVRKRNLQSQRRKNLNQLLVIPLDSPMLWPRPPQRLCQHPQVLRRRNLLLNQSQNVLISHPPHPPSHLHHHSHPPLHLLRKKKQRKRKLLKPQKSKKKRKLKK